MTITTIARTALALAIFAAPLSAQIDVRRPDHGRGRSTSTTTTTSNGSVLGGVFGGTTRSTDRIPPGQLPPRGMCRVWIDGVPPGQQPAVTDCATAQRQALGRANAHVIYGDEQSFPGKGKGKFKNKSGSLNDSRASNSSCSVWDVVVVMGRQVPVCRARTQQGTVIDRRTRDRDDRLHDDDDDQGDDGRVEKSKKHRGSEYRGKSKKGKGHGDE